ncbi:hypothetical protein BKA70DRAFT_1358896 [Coprinopsis sp. MPI-PUGE-AT-0042]|nr:hypothetical protein BKA70DRAFT_1358896 [Coprinopsis sp. MPI-PUGE-AT-0042]
MTSAQKRIFTRNLPVLLILYLFASVSSSLPIAPNGPIRLIQPSTEVGPMLKSQLLEVPEGMSEVVRLTAREPWFTFNPWNILSEAHRHSYDNPPVNGH